MPKRQKKLTPPKSWLPRPGERHPSTYRYWLTLWSQGQTWGLPLATWRADAPEPLLRQAAEGAFVVGLQGMRYRLWDMQEGKPVVIPENGGQP